MLALILLLVALAGVVVKDRQFWFGSDQSDLDVAQPAASSKTASNSVSSVTTPRAAVAPAAKKQIPAAKTSIESSVAATPAVSTTRTVLPPLDVEVIAGDTHSRIHPGSNSAKVEITRPGSVALAAATNAAERERMSTEPSPASYPLLAQHMSVQGSVVLQAIISAEGIVQDIHVLSGPTILATAARQAVREWRFKPVVQNGQAVETKANITVNFTIKVADSSEKTTLAESRASESMTVTR
jgi:TonB family protein